MPSPGALFISLIAGIVGVIAWRKGKSDSEMRPMAAGVALIAYGYFVPNPWLALAIGIGLTVIAFWP